MARSRNAPGERPLFWAGTSKRDLLDFPEAVKDEIGVALSVAQFGGKHPSAKPWKSKGVAVLEIVEDFRGDTYRAVYTVKVEGCRLCATCFPEEIAEGHKNSSKRCGINCSKAQKCTRGLRSALWQREEIARL